jgi:PAS domain S-box-containing protein
MKKYIIIIFLIYLNTYHIFGQSQQIKFERVSVNQGLSQSTVNCLIQDSYGFLWIGTIDGLNKYDGYKFKVYKPDPDDSTSLSNNHIYSIIEDKNNNLWIGTRNGLNVFNREKENFIRYINDPADSTTISHNNVNKVYFDKKGTTWIATNKGLNKFLPDKKQFITFDNNPKDSSTLSHNIVYCMFEDRSGNFWVGTHKGLDLMDRSNGKFRTFYSVPNNPNSLTNNTIKILYEDEFETLWVGTDGGLNKMDRFREKFTYYVSNMDDPFSLKSGGIFDVYQDSKSVIWVATWQGGLSRYDRKNDRFTSYFNSPNDEFSLSYNSVSSICEDKAGILWVGTWGGGLNKYDEQKAKFKCFQNLSNNPNGLSNNYVCALFEDHIGEVWIGTWGGGLNRYNPKTQIYKRYIKNEDPNSLNDENVYAVLEHDDGTLWFGTRRGINIYNPKKDNFSFLSPGPESGKLNNGVVRTMLKTSNGSVWVGTDGGLHYYRADSAKFEVFTSNLQDSTTISNDRIRKIIEAPNGILWVGTAIGLNRFDIKTKKFKRYLVNPKNRNSLSNDYIWSIALDADGNIWIGTNGGGLDKLDPKTNSFTHYREKDGLPNDGIWGVLIDNKGYIWLSTNKGISKFDPKKTIFDVYTANDGLQSNEFNGGAYFKSKDGKMFFGGIKGFNMFYPDSIMKNNYISPVLISDFQILNQTVKPGSSSALQKSIILTDHVTLTHNDYIFSFEFTSLHFSTPESNKFAYKLEGFDKDWVNTDSKRRFAYYTNLDPGDYVFKVKGTNNDGVWNPKETVIKITILPPFYETWWFRIFLFIIILSCILGFYRYRITNINRQKEELEKQVIERTREIVHKNEVLEIQKQEIVSQTEQLAISNRELERLSIVARETDNAIIIMDENGKPEWVNESYSKLFEFDLEQIATIIGPNTNPEVRQYIDLCINTKHTINYECKSQTKDKQQRWVQVTLTPILDEKGSIRKLIAIDSDITKIKEAEEEIQQQAEELILQAETLQKTNEALQHEKEYTMGGIRYGLTIQEAILPKKSYIDVFFESFIIYRPKDIVSGDFYWFANIPSPGALPDRIFVAVVDCTGHGVPGAFMSMIGNRLLNEIVIEKRIDDPKEILTYLDMGIVKALKQNQSENDDGMDICFCLIETFLDERKKVTFAGAKRPLFYYQKGTSIINILNADRRSIGGAKLKRESIPFSNKVITLHPEDLIYLATDGMIDQNGADRKRFGTTRFIEALFHNVHHSMSEQKKLLEMALDLYQQNQLQRDDITVLGLKV